MTDRELEAHFKVIATSFTKLERTVGTILTDMANDRGDLNDFTVELARVGAIVGSLVKRQEQMAGKVGDSTEEAIDPLRKEVKKLEKTISIKKSLAFKRPSRLFFWKK